MICTFFGHRFVKDEIFSTLNLTLVDLIENHNVKLFYVGNHGGFDSMVCRALQNLSKRYPIQYYIVLSYMPTKKNATEDLNTILPDGIERVPKRFAISYCNQWMIRQSDYVVTYVTRTIGSGAAQFKEKAQKQGKVVIELSKK